MEFSFDCLYTTYTLLVFASIYKLLHISSWSFYLTYPLIS